jgi:GT2 family glycosyltransferase
MRKTPSVAIIILNWNTSHYLKQFLPFVLSATYPNKAVYVIDNHSADDSLAMLVEYFPTVRIIRMYSNEGYASGYNRGFEQIQSDYFILVNSDIQVTAGFIEPVIELMEKDPSISICQPKLLSLDDPSRFEYAGAAGGWIDRLGYPFAKGRVFLSLEQDKGQYDQAGQLFWASGACMFLKSSVYRTIGGFYEYYHMHQEDIDLCWRAHQAGLKIYSCPQSVVYHIGGGSLSWKNNYKTFLTFRNNYILLTRNLSLVPGVAVLSFRLAADLIGSLYLMLTGRPGIGWAIFKAQWAYLFWLLFVPHKMHGQPKGFRNHPGVYRGTILWPYFMGNKRKFADIIHEASQAK